MNLRKASIYGLLSIGLNGCIVTAPLSTEFLSDDELRGSFQFEFDRSKECFRQKIYEITYDFSRGGYVRAVTNFKPNNKITYLPRSMNQRDSDLEVAVHEIFHMNLTSKTQKEIGKYLIDIYSYEIPDTIGDISIETGAYFVADFLNKNSRAREIYDNDTKIQELLGKKDIDMQCLARLNEKKW